MRDQHGWSRKWRGGSWSGGHDQPQVSLDPADVRLNGGNVGNYILHMHI